MIFFKKKNNEKFRKLENANPVVKRCQSLLRGVTVDQNDLKMHVMDAINENSLEQFGEKINVFGQIAVIIVKLNERRAQFGVK